MTDKRRRARNERETRSDTSDSLPLTALEFDLLANVYAAPDELPIARQYVRQPNAFFLDRTHGPIYAGMCAIYDEGGDPADLTALEDYLRRAGHLDTPADETAFLAKIGDLMSAGVKTEERDREKRVTYYAKVVQDVKAKRAMYDLAKQFAGASTAQTGELDAPAQLAQLATEAQETARRLGAGTGGLRFQFQAIADLRQRTLPEVLIDGLLMRRATSVVHGDGGVGKTVLLTSMACHVSESMRYRGREVCGGPVYYIAAEGGDIIRFQAEAWMLEYGKADLPNLYILDVPAYIADEQDRADLIAALRAAPVPPVWLILDTISATSVGLSDSDNGDMGAYVGAMIAIRNEIGCHVTAVHHDGHNGQLRGATAIRDNVDTQLHVMRDGVLSKVECGKQRGGWASFTSFHFKIKPVAFDDYGTFSGAVAVEPEPGEQPEPVGTRLTPGELAVLRAIADAPGQTLGANAWQRASDIPATSFARARRRLYETLAYVQKTPGSEDYQLSLSGARALKRADTTNHYHGTTTGDDGTATTATNP